MLFDFLEPLLPEGRSMYMQLYEQISAAVQDGVLKPGEKMPSIRESAAQLGVSRTTVENAYMKLCIEGIAESRPQRGYFICGRPERIAAKPLEQPRQFKIRYDFSTQKIDPVAADIEVWRKAVRAVLTDTEQLISYGDPKGEPALRQILCDYSFKTRGVRCRPENIVTGAGIGPLLNILCGLLGRNIRAGIENGGFKQAQQIFCDYSIPCRILESDRSGALMDSIERENINLLFLLPSALSKISVTDLARRRSEFLRWVAQSPERIIVEDDYNGELRYSARSVSSLQGKAAGDVVYIGSFSKLLLPSVRIAYMVLPDRLAERFEQKKKYYNQTCGKTEQLALASYIESGLLEKHLRRLRKLYSTKEKLLCAALRREISSLQDIKLFESSVTVQLKTDLKADSSELCRAALNLGIRVIPAAEQGSVRLCFAGIGAEDIESAVAELNRSWAIFSKNP